MNLTLEQIKKGPILPVYLLYGSESYFLMQYRDILLKRVVTPGDDMNFTRYTEENFDIDAFIDTARTMPFFAERRVILVQRANLFSKKNDKLADFLKSPDDSCCIIFVEEKVSQSYGPYKTIKKTGGIFEFKRPNQHQLETWLLRKVQVTNKRITREAFEEFWIRAGDDMAKMSTEMDKLLAYCHDKDDITIEEVRDICCGGAQSNIFKLTDAFSTKDTRGAFLICDNLLEQKETPVRIISMICRQLYQLLTVKQMSAARAPVKQIAEAAHAPISVIEKIRRMALNFSEEEIKHLLSTASDLDSQIKTGRIDKEMALTLLIRAGTEK